MSRDSLIPVAGPSVTEREIRYVAEAAATAWYEHANDFHLRFEHAFAEHAGRRHAMALPSCTSALHLVLAALGIGPGDEVIVPDLTWIATSAPIRYVGATPVFADVDAHTWCLDAASLARCITPRTKAAIAVGLYGGMGDMGALEDVCDAHGIALIEDAAEALGASWNGRRAGAFGVASAFSFHGSKTLTTGEGGMLLTDDRDLYERALVLRDHGRAPGDPVFFNREIGFKYKMSSLQAAFGLAQMERVEELVAKKRDIFSWYAEELAGVRGVTLNHEPLGTRNGYWMTTAVLDPALGLPKERLGAALRERGVDSRPFFHPLSSLPAYRDDPEARAAASRNGNAYRLSPWGVNLPSALNLDRATVARVCDAFRTILASLPDPSH